MGSAIFLGVLLSFLALVRSSTLDKTEWQPVFEIPSGSGLKVYELWAREMVFNEEGTFKTDLANTWAGVKKVKFSLKSGNLDVVTLVFDARDSDRFSWFRAERLISSFPYTDLPGKYQKYFSIQGDDADHRFFINRQSGGCTDSKAWIVVVDGDSGNCQVERSAPKPIFLYSQWHGYANTMHLSKAETLTISVEADDPSQWDMVFRATSGVNANIFNLWTSDEIRNAESEDMRSMLSNVAGVYKSNRVNTWEQVNKVKVAMYKNGQEVAYFTFDGTESDRMSWFAIDRLISSSYTDIEDHNINYFSVKGHDVNNSVKRRFYVMRNYASFCVDYGWFMVLDKDSRRGCDWDVEGPNPSFRYSRERTVTLAEGFGRADVFAVFFNKEQKPVSDVLPEIPYTDVPSHWTRVRTGCQCYFDQTRLDCACCVDGGCQCTIEHPQQCVQCGYNERCGLAEAVSGAWTGNSTCACRNDHGSLTCACCHNNGCQCVENSLQCTQCGREDLC